MPHDAPQEARAAASDDPTCGTCCGQTAGGPADVPGPPPEAGRSFRVNGLDCAEEVAILNRVVGPEVGGADNLAFDVLNGRMTVLAGAEGMSDARLIEIVGSTGMSAKPWDAETAEADQAAHFRRQRLFTALAGGFWAAGFGYHVVETGLAGAVGIFSGHGETAMPLVEVGLFLLAVLFGTWLVAPKAWSAARRLSPDMNLLMVVAVAGAIGLGEFFEGGHGGVLLRAVADAGILERGPREECGLRAPRPRAAHGAGGPRRRI